MTTSTRALITGITGQDGSYLAELLLAKGYEVHGIIRRSSSFNTERIDHLYQDPHVPKRAPRPPLRRPQRRVVAEPHPAARRAARDLQPRRAEPREGLASTSRSTRREVTALGATRLLEAIREVGLRPRFYQASSSEMFGKVAETPQTETTPFHPR